MGRLATLFSSSRKPHSHACKWMLQSKSYWSLIFVFFLPGPLSNGNERTAQEVERQSFSKILKATKECFTKSFKKVLGYSYTYFFSFFAKSESKTSTFFSVLCWNCDLFFSGHHMGECHSFSQIFVFWWNKTHLVRYPWTQQSKYKHYRSLRLHKYIDGKRIFRLYLYVVQ